MNINRLTFLFQINTLASHSFLPHLIKPQATIVDLGATRGEFFREFTSRFSVARYIAVEPNSKLTDWAKNNTTIELRNYALTRTDGPVTFCVDENPEASHVASAGETTGNQITVEGLSFTSIVSELRIDQIDLLKMDIEGSEIDLILHTPTEILRRIDPPVKAGGIALCPPV